MAVSICSIQFRTPYEPTELIHRERFTWTEWVEAHEWDVVRAVEASQRMVDDGIFLLMDQQVDGLEVWDGYIEFHREAGVPIYVGMSAPSGEGVERAKQIIGSDTFTVHQV